MWVMWRFHRVEISPLNPTNPSPFQMVREQILHYQVSYRRSSFVTGETHQATKNYHGLYLTILHAFHELNAKTKEIRLEFALDHTPLQQHNLKPQPHPGLVHRPPHCSRIIIDLTTMIA